MIFTTIWTIELSYNVYKNNLFMCYPAFFRQFYHVSLKTSVDVLGILEFRVY